MSEASKRGRPSSYSEEVAARICEELADGASLRKICSADGMPRKSSVFRWLADPANESFRIQYAAALEARADTLADEIVDIADDASEDFKSVERDGEMVEAFDHEHVQRSKLRVDARKWVASKLKPKKYGDRIEHAGSVGVGPFDKLPTATIAALVNALGGAGEDPQGGSSGAGAA